MKNVENIRVDENFKIELSERMKKHLNINTRDELKVLYTYEALIIMKSEVFGEKNFKKLALFCWQCQKMWYTIIVLAILYIERQKNRKGDCDVYFW